MLGSARLQACWFRRRAETNFPFLSQRKDEQVLRKVRDREDALASTRATCAPQNSQRDLVELLHPFGLTHPDVTRF
jgi:hypothetical protein